MRYICVVGVLVLVGVVVAFEEQDHSEDFESKGRQKRWLFTDKCKAHSDCGSNGCCDHSWFGNSCINKRRMFERCSPNPKCGCHCGCLQGLECKQFRGHHWPYPRLYMCVRPAPTSPPTEEPGSGDFE